jgi:hypothetical protein
MSSSLAEEKLDARATDVKVTDETISVDLEDGRTIIVPTAWIPRLRFATEAERKNYKLSPWGIEWPDVEADVSIRGLLLGNKSGENPESFKYWLDNRKKGKRVSVMDWLAARKRSKATTSPVKQKRPARVAAGR